MCWRHTMLPWTTLRLGWGCISSGAGTASAILASEWPLHPNTSHLHLPHAPLMCWRHAMLPWTTLRLGWGCISSGEEPNSGLHGNSKSDAVLDSWLIICVLFMRNCCKKKTIVLGWNWNQTAKLWSNRTVRWARSCTVWHRNFGQP